MNRPTPGRRATTWAILLGCVVALARCGHERVAGSSVTTGNPTEIQVGFTGENGPMALAGRVEIFAANQIPVPGFQPDPLKRYDVDGDRFILDAGRFEGIADSLWANGSLEGDSLARFNLVFTDGNQGSILRGLGFRLKDGKFSFDEAPFTAVEGGSVTMTVSLTPMMGYRAFIDPSLIFAERNEYVFIPGTAFSAQEESGQFTLPSIPAGRHDFAYLSVPLEDLAGKEDSVNVIDLNRSPDATTVDSLVSGGLKIRIPMPDEYKAKP